MVGIWLWVMIFLLVAIVCYSYLYIIEGDFQHSSGYVRYTLIGFAIIFLSHNFIKLSPEIATKLIPNYGKYIFVFLVIDIIVMFFYFLLKKDNYKLLITEYIYILIYIFLGMGLSLLVIKSPDTSYEKLQEMCFACILVLITAQSCILIMLNGYKKGERKLKIRFHILIFILLLIALVIEKLEIKSIRTYKHILEILLFLITGIIFSLNIKKKDKIKSTSSKWIKLK